jgi:hypothetical protein
MKRAVRLNETQRSVIDENCVYKQHTSAARTWFVTTLKSMQSKNLESTTTGARQASSTCVIKNHKVIEFWKGQKDSLRATICDIDGTPFVGLSKFGYNAIIQNWYPRAKGHLYMKADQWGCLLDHVDGISNELKEHVRSSMASSGT